MPTARRGLKSGAYDPNSDNKAEAQARLPFVLKGKDRRLGQCYPAPTHEEGQQAL